MGGFFGAVLGGLGQAAQQRNLMNVGIQAKANEETANALEQLGQTAKPEYAADYHVMAARYRALGGDKPKKDMALDNVILRQVHQQSQPPQQPQGPPAGAPNTLKPPPDSTNSNGVTVTNDALGGGVLPPDLPAPPSATPSAPPSGQPNTAGGGYNDSGTPNAVAGGTPPSSGYGTLPAPPSAQPTTQPANPVSRGIPIAAGAFDTGQGAFMHNGQMVTNTQYTPEEIGMRTARIKGYEYTAQNQAELDRQLALAGASRQVRQQQIKDLQSSGAWDKLSPRQQSELMVGATNITPELRPMNVPGLMQGSNLPSGSTDALGNPIDMNSMYRAQRNPDGSLNYFPELGTTQGTVMPDSNSSTGFSRVVIDRAGHEVSRMTGATPPSAFVPTTTTSQRAVQVGNSVVMVPESSTRTRTLPGGGRSTGAGTAALPAPPSSKRSSSSTPAVSAPTGTDTSNLNLPRGSRVLGPTPAETNRQEQNPLTPGAQSILETTQPTLNMVQKLKKALEPYKNDNSPSAELLPRLTYAMGYGSDQSQFLSNLEMSRITSAARILKGSSRASTMLDRALIHTPNAWKDSKKLMYDKVSNIEANLNDIMSSAKQYGQKYPGMKSSNSNLAPPPTLAPSSYSHYAVGPGGHRIGTNDGRSWFDAATGQAVQ